MDPNVIITSLILSTIAGVGGWLWSKLRGAKTESLEAMWRRTIDAAFEHELDEAIDEKLSAIATRYRLEDAAFVVLERLGVKKSNAPARRIVGELVELGVAEFRRRLREAAAAKRLPRELEKLEKAMKGATDAFDLEKIPKLEDAPNVEVVPRDGSEKFTKPFAGDSTKPFAGDST
jgi:hypothetical protein